jgi:hypothetical protein
MSERLKNMGADELALALRKTYCLSGAQFCAGELEASWLMIGKLQAELTSIKALAQVVVDELKFVVQEPNWDKLPQLVDNLAAAIEVTP